MANLIMFDSTISIGNILTVIGGAGGGIFAFIRVCSEFAGIKAKLAEREIASQKIQDDINKVEDKVDRLLFHMLDKE